MKKKKTKQAPYTLTPRDADILIYLTKKSIATRKLLFNKFWSHAKPNTNSHHKRLRHLNKHGLIDFLFQGSTESAVKLSQKGYNEVKVAWPTSSVPKFSKRNYTSQFKHDHLVTEVLDELEKHICIDDTYLEKDFDKVFGEKISYSNYQKNRYKIPDALIEIYFGDNASWAAIEVEMSQKSEKRYKEIFINHFKEKHWGFVLYFVKNQKLLNKLQSIATRVLKYESYRIYKRTPNGIYFITLEDFFKNKENAEFKNEISKITLRDLNKIHEFGFKAFEPT